MIRKGWRLYCRFKSDTLISEIKIGKRGGVYAKVGDTWKYCRKTRSTGVTA